MRAPPDRARVELRLHVELHQLLDAMRRTADAGKVLGECIVAMLLGDGHASPAVADVLGPYGVTALMSPADRLMRWRLIDDEAVNGASWLIGRPGVPPARGFYRDGTWWLHGCGPNSRHPTGLTGEYAPTHYQPLPSPPP